MNLSDVKALTEKTLAAQLSTYGFDHVDIRSKQDEDEEDALYMVANYRSGSPLPTGVVLNRTLAILRRELQNAGEERFPYLTHHLEGEESEYDDEDAAK